MAELLAMKINVNNVELQVVFAGAISPSKPTLLFLHHFGGSSRTWGEVLSLLSSDALHCIAPDLRGFGESEPGSLGAGPESHVDVMASDVRLLIESLRLTEERFVIVGHSMGAKVALAVAAERPRGLAGLLLLAPSPPSPEPISKDERARLLNGFGDLAAARQTLGKITARALPTPLVELALEDMRRSSRSGWNAWLQQGSREDISARISDLAIPVRIAAGAEDETITEALIRREIIARIPSAQIEIIPGAAHLLPLEAAESVATLLRACAESWR